MKTMLNQFARVTALAAGLGMAAILPLQAQAGDDAIEGVPEITQLGPKGQPVHPVVRDGEDMRHIVEAGPEGQPAPVVIRDGEGDPAIDRLGPTQRERRHYDLAGDVGEPEIM